jgi:hypothetical protein
MRGDDVTDPFRIDGPAILNISGGRTSALMLRRILDAHGGRLPADVHAVFCNTGKEREETLTFLHRCAQEWDARIAWVERDRDVQGRIRDVDIATASRNSEPFDRIIREKQFLPNTVMRFCTQELKIDPARRFMLAQGYSEWVSVVGLRYDEPARVSRIRARDHGDWTVACPLYDARVTRADVGAFWASQSFDLGLREWESNCAGCFLRSRYVLERVERDRPGTLDWWDEWEQRMGATFYKGRNMADIKARARMPMLRIFNQDDPAPDLPCACTD